MRSYESLVYALSAILENTRGEGLGLPIQLGGNFTFDIDALALFSDGAEREAGADLV